MSGFECSVPGARPVEVIKHQIHVILLFSLQVVTNFYVTMNLDLDVRISLAAQGTGLCQLARSIVVCLLLPVHSTALRLASHLSCVLSVDG